jgi:hypothetical protein
MHPRMQRLVFTATVVTLTACGGDVPVSPADTFNRSGADGAAAYAVTLSDGTKQIGVGESVTLRGSSSESRGRTLRWSSSNTSVVSVTSSGTISGRAVGAATVTARGSNGNSSQFRINVVPMSTPTAPVVAVVEIAVPSPTMPVAGTMTLSATARDGAGVAITGRPVTWSAVGSAVTVSSTGVVTAVTAGSADVRATVDGVAGSTSIVVVAPTVASLTISPKTGATLAPGTTRQFSTSATWSDLATRAVSVTYTATGGTISSNGLYTAGQLIGTFMVIANCACGRADTAAVSITSVPAQLTRLAISPKTATVNAGATQQFAATANWSTGATTLPPVTYSATGGSVTSAGLYTAPSTGGTYRVIVAHSGGTLRDTATVTVPGATDVAPPSPGTGTPFFQDKFDNGQKTSANGFTWGSTTAVTVSAERAYSGTHALRFNYSAAVAGKDGFSEQRFNLGRYVSELSIEYMLYVPANFKHRVEAPDNNKFIMLWRDQYSQNGTWQIGWEYTRNSDTQSDGRFTSSRWDFDWITDGGPWPSPYPVRSMPLMGTAGPIRAGQWNRVQIHVKSASSRTAEDGQSHLWVNGTLIHSYTKGRFHNFNAAVTEAQLRNGYFMGWANSGFTEQTTFFIDDVKFYQGNPGWF